MAKAQEKELGFEESLSALEKVVAQLESGDLPLERALEIFEDGVGLARRCQSQLEEAERKVEVLLRERGEIKTVPFEPKVETSGGDNDKKASSNASHLTSIATDDPMEPEAESLDDCIPF